MEKKKTEELPKAMPELEAARLHALVLQLQLLRETDVYRQHQALQARVFAAMDLYKMDRGKAIDAQVNFETGEIKR